MYGTLNFKDDPTHVRVYSVKELSALLSGHGCTVIRSGIRRNIWFILAMPFRILASLIKGKRSRAIFLGSPRVRRVCVGQEN